MNQLMSESDIATVTGFTSMSKQCEVFKDHGIHYVKDRNGCPHVTWYSFNHPAHLRFDQSMAHNEEPNFASMD